MTEATEGPLEQEPAGLDAILADSLKEYEAAPEEQADERPRDEKGRFVAKEQPESVEAAPSDVKEPAAVETKPAEAAPVDPAVVQPIDPHPRWSAELKAEFAKWPPEIQKAFRERYSETEADYTRKTQELAESRKSIEPLIGEVQRVSPFLQQIGMQPHEFVAQSATVAMNLMSSQPQQQGQAIAYLMNLHGIHPATVLQALGISDSQVGEGVKAPDPIITQLHQQVAGLQRQLQGFQESQTQAERQRAQAEFDALGLTKDQDGRPKYPHFDRVKGAMIQLVASGHAETWDSAYQKAVRLDDELHNQAVEAERKRAFDEAEKARLDAVEKAKKAQPVKTSDGPPKGDNVRKGLDAHLNAAMENRFAN